MNFLDWTVIGFYIAGIIGTALLLSRSQRSLTDYYLAGKKITWWQSGISTMATQLSAVSFVSAPAFVALKKGGGLKWLGYEFGVPLSLILVMAIIIPKLHQGHFISIYEYLEKRFDNTTRSLVSLLFLTGRALATAVAVLTGGIILSSALSISTEAAIILVGIVTIVYDALGGIRIVILSDVMQMIIILVGIAVCAAAALTIVDWDTAWTSLSADRTTILDFRQGGFSSQGTYGFWPMLFGGIVLYASYYGCDQSQVQRELTVGDVNAVKKSLLVNAVGRFPIVFLYCVMGVLIGAVVSTPDAKETLGLMLHTDTTGITQLLETDPDRMVPLFILAYLPHGVIGLIFVAIMAALMSSLDSALNSLSAVTIRDFYQRYLRPNENDGHYLMASRVCTLFWGVFCIVAALAFSWSAEATRQTTLVLINAVGSMLYGPILAAFLLGMLTSSVSARAIKAGIVLGIVTNLFLWQGTDISWLWWNVAGLSVSALVALAYTATGLMDSNFAAIVHAEKPTTWSGTKRWNLVYGLLIAYFFFILWFCYFLEKVI